VSQNYSKKSVDQIDQLKKPATRVAGEIKPIKKK